MSASPSYGALASRMKRFRLQDEATQASLYLEMAQLAIQAAHERLSNGHPMEGHILKHLGALVNLQTRVNGFCDGVVGG